jgi:hypothetical protein
MHTTDVPIQVGVGWVWDGESAHLVSCMRDMSAWKSRTRALQCDVVSCVCSARLVRVVCLRTRFCRARVCVC